MNIIERRAYARAGLVGNPSDGYHGKTLSFTFRNFSARVVMYPWEHLEIVFSSQDKNRFRSLDELVQDVELNGYYGGVRLVKAAVKKFVELCRAEGWPLEREPFSIRYESNIPRGVGLAGSSAIVVASLKCLVAYYDVPLPEDAMASLARSVEHEELGITCGYQDRVIQVYDGLVYMDFAEEKMRRVCGYECGEYVRLDSARLPPLYIAYDVEASKVSGAVHGPLATRVKKDAQLAETMDRIAALTPEARQAIEAQDWKQLHESINRNFDLRTELYEIPQHRREMVRIAREVGASAKFAGSGGAIVGTYEDDAMYERLRQALCGANKQWAIVRPEIAG